MIDFHIHNQGKSIEDVAYIVERATRLGIEHMVNLGDVFAHGFVPDEEQIREINDWTIEISRHFPKEITGFMFLNPDNPAESLSDEIKRCVDAGLKGIKLEASLNTREPKMSTVVEAAIELDLPFLQHCWNKSSNMLERESDSSDVAFMAAKYPELKIVCLNSTIFEMEKLLTQASNIYCDMAYTEMGDTIKTLMEKVNYAQIVFGSHTPFFTTGAQLMKINHSEVSDKIKGEILHSSLL